MIPRRDRCADENETSLESFPARSAGGPQTLSQGLKSLISDRSDSIPAVLSLSVGVFPLCRRRCGKILAFRRPAGPPSLQPPLQTKRLFFFFLLSRDGEPQLKGCETHRPTNAKLFVTCCCVCALVASLNGPSLGEILGEICGRSGRSLGQGTMDILALSVPSPSWPVGCCCIYACGPILPRVFLAFLDRGHPEPKCRPPTYRVMPGRALLPVPPLSDGFVSCGRRLFPSCHPKPP